MDRLRQKLRKDKSGKISSKDRNQMSETDVNSIRENLKIREILRNVKMNSSMRLKARPGSKVMNNKDFSDVEGYFDDDVSVKESDSELQETPSAMNPDVVLASLSEVNNKSDSSITKVDCSKINDSDNIDQNEEAYHLQKTVSDSDITCLQQLNDSDSSEYLNLESQENSKENSMREFLNEIPSVNHLRDRKLSLDQALLTRRYGITQSEFDLHTLGKSPLERKSSFFRKKMDSFLRNTTEIFRKQSTIRKSQPMQRRGSMSTSLQSLNENCNANGDNTEYSVDMSRLERQSTTSVQTSSTITRSSSSLLCPRSRLHELSEHSLAGSQPSLNSSSSQTLGEASSTSMHSLNESYLREAMLKSRAISMSSGLDYPPDYQRRKALRSNRVTWVASEGLTNYFRRLIQDEKSKELQTCNSYQDFSSIPENQTYTPSVDCKGRRLSYQRAVSGEDPVSSPRYHDSSLRRRHLIPENSEEIFDIHLLLERFDESGIPQPLLHIPMAIPPKALEFAEWASSVDGVGLPILGSHNSRENLKQAAIRELIQTEVDYLNDLMTIVDTFMSTIFALQEANTLRNIDAEKLFSNVPDILHANINLWYQAFDQMVSEGLQNNGVFEIELMANGFKRFREILHPYEQYMVDQKKIIEYFKQIHNQPELFTILNWCYNRTSCHRLQFTDMLVKPMQRFTKYELLIRRITYYTDNVQQIRILQTMERNAKDYVNEVNRYLRQRSELELVDKIAIIIEPYEVEFKDDDMDRVYRHFMTLQIRGFSYSTFGRQHRSLIVDGYMRFKDQIGKEFEVRVFVFSDMILICKKQKTGLPYKMLRSRYMLKRLNYWPRYNKTTNQLSGHILLQVDEIGSAVSCFTLTESARDPNPSQTLKTWDSKLRLAFMVYELSVTAAKNPDMPLNEIKLKAICDPMGKNMMVEPTGEDISLLNEAREIIATMLRREVVNPEDHHLRTTSASFDGTMPGVSPCSTQPAISTLNKSQDLPSSSEQFRRSSVQLSSSKPAEDQSNSRRYSTIPTINQHNENTVDVTVPNQTTDNEAEKFKGTPQTPLPTMTSQAVMKPYYTSHNQVSTMLSLPDLTLATHALGRRRHAIIPDNPFDRVGSVTDPNTTLGRPMSISEHLYKTHKEKMMLRRLTQSTTLSIPDPKDRGHFSRSPIRGTFLRGITITGSSKKIANVQAQLETAGPSTSGQASRGSSPSPSDKNNGKNKVQVIRNKTLMNHPDDTGSSTSKAEPRQQSQQKAPPEQQVQHVPQTPPVQQTLPVSHIPQESQEPQVQQAPPVPAVPHVPPVQQVPQEQQAPPIQQAQHQQARVERRERPRECRHRRQPRGLRIVYDDDIE